MRGRLYPQPRARYERFRLNPYSPLYEGLAVFVSAPPVANELPELHGPYALPGAAYYINGSNVVHRFFPEIGRAAISPSNNWSAFWWPIVPIRSPKVITLTTINRVAGTIDQGHFISLRETIGGIAPVGLAERYPPTSPNYPRYFWRNVGEGYSIGLSEGKFWPLNTWFTFSGTFRLGSVSGYLSNWGIIDVTLSSGQWPNNLVDSCYLQVAPYTSGAFVADALIHLRELSLTELDAISDYGNVDLRIPGEAPLILPVRTYWPSVLPVAPSYLKRRSLGVRVGTREAAL